MLALNKCIVFIKLTFDSKKFSINTKNKMEDGMKFIYYSKKHNAARLYIKNAILFGKIDHTES